MNSFEWKNFNRITVMKQKISFKSYCQLETDYEREDNILYKINRKTS